MAIVVNKSGLVQSKTMGGLRVQNFRLDKFLIALVLTLTAATLLPCSGISAQAFGLLGKVAIGSLFFLQGARLSRDAVLSGLTHWRLHFIIAGTTFVAFPLLGSLLIVAVPGALSQTLWLGVLFVCALPSTVQSSTALTSMARGNVAGAICSATASNLVGILLTPIVFGLLVHLHGSGFQATGLLTIMAQLLVPFAAGHALRPWIGQWAERNRGLLAITDRGSILIVVYTAFSAAVLMNIWHRVPPVTFATLWVIEGALLGASFVIISTGGHALGLSAEDKVAALFCGSQKSLVAGIPIASVMFAGPAMGTIVLPMMTYYVLQLVVCAEIARRIALVPNAVTTNRFIPESAP